MTTDEINREEVRQVLSQVLWIGGATDSGKTTVAKIIAERYGLQVYHYDRHDLPHHERLAQTNDEYRLWLSASLDERWVYPAPEHLLEELLRSFQDRFPLVIEDLLALPRHPMLIAEGFGLTPDLVAPLLSNAQLAIWLVPTVDFKWASMIRRDKPAWRSETSNPERARRNLFERDLMLAQLIRTQARMRDLTIIEIDGSRSTDEVASFVEHHFGTRLTKQQTQLEGRE